MPVPIECARCLTTFTPKAEMDGRKRRCLGCGRRIRVVSSRGKASGLLSGLVAVTLGILGLVAR
jgi:hypothetical protein